MNYYKVINRNKETVHVQTSKDQKDVLSKNSKSQNIIPFTYF